MELTPRLRAVADQVPQGSRLADVGTDHGYLPVWLILRGMLSGAIAADLRSGPLERARQTARQHGVEERISFRQCDGLSAIGGNEVDAVALAGMGGDTIASILAAAPWTRGKTLLLQPMTGFPSLRHFLQSHGYCILDERIAREGERLYTIWRATGGQMDPLSRAELWVGQQREDPLRGAYLDRMAGKVERALAGRLASRNREEGEIQALWEALEGIRHMRKEL